MHGDGTPFGITLVALAGNDAALASIGRVFHADTALPLGATGKALARLHVKPIRAVAAHCVVAGFALSPCGRGLLGVSTNLNG